MKNNRNAVMMTALISSLIASPLLMTPKAYALTDFSVDVDDETTDKVTDYSFTFTPEKDLSSGDKITIQFPSGYDPKDDDVTKSDVYVNDESPKKVEVTSSGIIITVDEDLDADEEVEVTVDSLRNPSSSGNYTIKLKTNRETEWESDKVSISKSSSSSSKKGFSVEMDSTKTGVDTGIKLGPIDLDDDLVKAEWIYVTFPTNDMLPGIIKTGYITINGYEPDDAQVVGKNEVKLKIPRKAENDDQLTVVFDDESAIQNPSVADNDYTFKVKYKSVTYTSKDVEISRNGSSSTTSGNYDVILSNKNAGERSSYTFDIDLGSRTLSYNDTITIEFPSADMLPGYLESQYITINGKNIRSGVYPSGKTVTITPPSNFSSSSTAKIIFSYYSYIENPKSTGSYQLKATIGGKTYTSKNFDIIGTSTIPTNPTVPTTPTTTNNSAATIGLSKSTLNTATGVTLGIKSLALPLVKNQDFLEVAFPSGFRVPAYINNTAISVNGVIPGYVTSRGQNLLIYPSQDITANVPVTVVIGESASIVTPAYASNYTLGVYTSEEKNVLYSRVLPIGAAVPVTTIPANAARLKLNVNSFTLSGKTYPLANAPYTYNNSTLVPAQFFKEGLAMTTVWNAKAASITSGKTQIKFTVGSDIAKVNNANVKLPVAVQVKNGMPMIPIRMVSDTLKYTLGWEAATNSITIYK